jgi:hypothetical protein
MHHQGARHRAGANEHELNVYELISFQLYNIYKHCVILDIGRQKCPTLMLLRNLFTHIETCKSNALNRPDSINFEKTRS